MLPLSSQSTGNLLDSFSSIGENEGLEGRGGVRFRGEVWRGGEGREGRGRGKGRGWGVEREIGYLAHD